MAAPTSFQPAMFSSASLRQESRSPRPGGGTAAALQSVSVTRPPPSSPVTRLSDVHERLPGESGCQGTLIPANSSLPIMRYPILLLRSLRPSRGFSQPQSVRPSHEPWQDPTGAWGHNEAPCPGHRRGHRCLGEDSEGPSQWRDRIRCLLRGLRESLARRRMVTRLCFARSSTRPPSHVPGRE